MGGGDVETSVRRLVEGLAKRMGWKMRWGNGGRKSMVQAMQRANAKRGIECERETWVVQGWTNWSYTANMVPITREEL